jgi:hypothetical protein
MMGQDYTLAIVLSRLILIRHSPWLRRAIAVMTFVAAALAFPQPALAGISVTGSVTSNTTWAVADSPITVTGNVTVDAGVTLTVEPGVTVEFDTGKVLDINGTLIAQGTSSDKVTFTSSAASPAAGDWGYIRFGASSVPASFDGSGDYLSGSIFQHCTVEYAGYGSSTANTTQAIRGVSSVSPFIDNCTIRHNADGGIHISSGLNQTVKITNNILDNNASHGMNLYVKAGSTFTIDGNTVTSSTSRGSNDSSGGDGIMLWSGTGAITGTVSNNTINGRRVVFATYQSSPRVAEAQAIGAPRFDLTIGGSIDS